MNTNSGWSQVDFATLTNGQTDETITFGAPLLSYATLSEDSTSVQVLMAVNNDWGAGLSGTIYYDNLRITPIIPDLDEDADVDAEDWGIFIGAHNTDLTGLPPSQQFLSGDLDSDGDNDFQDYLIFEAAYDEINGSGAFLGLIPEPAGCGLFLLGVSGILALRRKLKATLAIMALAAVSLTVCPQGAEAQLSNVLLNSWETGLENWTNFNGGAIPGSVDTSTIGATDGTQSLAVTQDEETFSWQAQVNYGTGSAQYDAIAAAVNTGIENFALEFDVTYDTGSIPQGVVTTVSTSVALNSSAGWFEYGGVSGSDGITDETVNVSIPLDQVLNPPTNGDGTWVPANQTGFYQINLGLDGDWGLDPATFYFDNLRLRQLAAPEVLNLEVDRGTGEITVQNNASGTYDFNYYTITSGGSSLDVGGWNSLDDQNLDAVDGPDPGTIAGDSVLEGWDEAGGSGADNLTEAFLLGNSTLNGLETISLGAGYNSAVDAQDLVFQYRDLNRPDSLTFGTVSYVGEPSIIDGDFDNNGLYQCADVDALVAAIVDANNGGTPDLSFDMTGDGTLDINDLDAWRAEAGDVGALTASGNPVQNGDATLDGVVDGQDFVAWNANKFTQTAAWCGGDFNADGNVDGQDFILWNANKFTSADGVNAVPEPQAWGILLLGLLLVSCRKN